MVGYAYLNFPAAIQSANADIGSLGWAMAPDAAKKLRSTVKVASTDSAMLMEGLVWIAETVSEPVGFLLAAPDFNVAFKPLNGHLLTPKLLGFIPYLLGWKLPPRTRVLTLGVKNKYRGRGLESAMLIEGLKVGFDAGFKESEASWILEDNVMMCRMLESIGGRAYKTYRIYEKAL